MRSFRCVWPRALAVVGCLGLGPVSAAPAPGVQVWEVDEDTTAGLVEVNASPEAVARVLADFRGWPRLFRDVTSISVVSADPKEATLRINFKVIGHDHTYRVVSGPQVVRAEMIDGEVGLKVLAEYRLEPGADGASTRVRLSVLASISGPVGWVIPDRTLRKRRVNKVQSDLSDLGKWTRW
jgi:hypothetical protein